MKDPLHTWAAYARGQAELAGRHVVDSRHWGLEAGLASLITAFAESGGSEALDRAVRTVSRGERHRARLRRIHYGRGEALHEPENQL
jgi:hypothetical protein